MRICFVDRTTKLSHVRELERKARGGMVASLFYVSDYLSAIGHNVTILSDIETEGRTFSGTMWLNDIHSQFDVLITNRGVGDGYPLIDAKKRVLWTHDLPHIGFIPEPKTVRAFDCTVFMSRYAERIWRAFFKTIGKSVLIPNGVDKKEFYPRQKDANYLIFASNPNRGLERVPFLFDCIKTQTGLPLKMRAYSNREALHPGEGGQFDNAYKCIEDSDIELCDPIPTVEFANQLGKASLMLLPTDYPEICSNVVLQSLVSGTPVITTGGLGATPEWVRDGKSGMLTKWYPHDYMVYQVDFVRKAISALNNNLIQGALKAKVYSWNEVGKLWERMLRRL